MDTTTSLVKYIVNNDKKLYLVLEWKENETDLFHVKIYEENGIWVGRYSIEFTHKYMEIVDETEDQYCKNVKHALTGKRDDFVYEFAIIPGDIEDTCSAKFTWKKVYKGLKLKAMEHGSVPLHRSNIVESQFTLVDYLVEQNQHLHNSIQSYKNKNEELEGELTKCRNNLQKFVDVKDTLESNLYGKFVHLLNAKKRRIQTLEQNFQIISDDVD